MKVFPGSRVRAPFGPRVALGTVLSVFEGEPARPLKPLERPIDSAPALAEEGVSCARWMSRRFVASIG